MINPVGYLGVVHDLTQIDAPSSISLLDRINQLVTNFESGLSRIEEVVEAAHLLIEELSNLGDKENAIPLAREGLCTLLSLNIEEIQHEVVGYLRRSFRLCYLIDDVKENQLQKLIILERKISTAIELYVHNSSNNLILSLLELYQDILERLWLLP